MPLSHLHFCGVTRHCGQPVQQSADASASEKHSVFISTAEGGNNVSPKSRVTKFAKQIIKQVDQMLIFSRPEKFETGKVNTSITSHIIIVLSRADRCSCIAGFALFRTLLQFDLTVIRVVCECLVPYSQGHL